MKGLERKMNGKWMEMFYNSEDGLFDEMELPDVLACASKAEP